MTVPADIRGEIVRLRTEGLTMHNIATLTGQPVKLVIEVCRKHFFAAEQRARAQLLREVEAGRREIERAEGFVRPQP